jgi:glycosyltransferase involved in cell wall biosynthesis
MNVALVHDYLTQRGGAERVVLAMVEAFPEAPLYTSLYEPDATYPEFRDVDVRTLPLNRLGTLRRDHRKALPFLAQSFGRLEIDADVVLCSSSGWAHGVRTEGRKLVYCHTPARWLYQPDRYLREVSLGRRLGAGLLTARLRSWDRAAARSATLYLANSTIVRERIMAAYGLAADVLPAPYLVDVDAPQRAVDVEPGYVLCVSRLMSHKNVDALMRAFTRLPGERLVIVGSGPDRARLEGLRSSATTILERVDDDELRWLYANCRAVASAAHEDFGLTPLEGGAFGKPAVVLRYGGFLDTVGEGVSGLFFDEAEPDAVAAAIAAALARDWDPATIRQHCEAFAPERFIGRLREIVAGHAVAAAA